MPIKRTLAGRSPEGEKLYVVRGDPLKWARDPATGAFWVQTDDAQYVVARPGAPGTDSKGHSLYRYWGARARIKDEVINLGDEYMVADEGMEVCQIYESARRENKIEVARKLEKPE